MKPGTLLEGRYEVTAELGRGAMAVVYEVVHKALGSRHALKVLAPSAGIEASEDLRRRFLDEGRIQAQLRHPHIVNVTDVVVHPVAGLVMERVSGPDLGAFIDARGPMAAPAAVALLLPVIEAVGEAHAHGVVHRDLKPENLLLDGDKLLVADFGVARLLDDALIAAARRRTVPGARIGTLQYMSPEGLRGEPVGPTSDLWALAAVLYELTTGRPAFDGTEYEVVSAIAEGRLPDTSSLPPRLALELQRAWARDPAKRFASAAELSVALEASVAAARAWERLGGRRTPGRGVTAPPPPPVDGAKAGAEPEAEPEAEAAVPAPRPTRPPKRVARGSWLASIAVMFASAGGTWALLAVWQGPSAPPAAQGPGGVALVAVHPGWFSMGTPVGEPGRDRDETRHDVALTRPYQLGAREVTQAEWQAVMGANPSALHRRAWDGAAPGAPCAEAGVGPGLPVTCLTWFEAVDFCNRLSEKAGLRPAYVVNGTSVTWQRGADGYRLPTEAEWERAARAGGDLPYGAAATAAGACGFANVLNPRSLQAFPWVSSRPFSCDDGYLGLAPAGALRPNAFGLYDMVGNVWEWTWDGYAPFSRVVASDPIGPLSAAKRVVRGGSWYDDPETLRVGNRFAGAPDGRSPFVGLRVAR